MTDTVRSDDELREVERLAIHGLTAELAEDTANLIAEQLPNVDVETPTDVLRAAIWAISSATAMQLARQLCAGCSDFADCPRHGEGAITRGRRVVENNELATSLGRPAAETLDDAAAAATRRAEANERSRNAGEPPPGWIWARDWAPFELWELDNDRDYAMATVTRPTRDEALDEAWRRFIGGGES